MKVRVVLKKRVMHGVSCVTCIDVKGAELRFIVLPQAIMKYRAATRIWCPLNNNMYHFHTC